MDFKIDSLEIVRRLKKGDIIMQHSDGKEKYKIDSINDIIVMVFKIPEMCVKAFPITHLLTDNWFIETNNGNYSDLYS
jgi:hypothetical protein